MRLTLSPRLGVPESHPLLARPVFKAFLVVGVTVAVARLALSLSVGAATGRGRLREDAGAVDGGIGSAVRVRIPSGCAVFPDAASLAFVETLAVSPCVIVSEGDKREARAPIEVTS